MAGIPLPKPISVTPFSVPANEPTYSQIFADTMGNLATPDDGMDAKLLALATLNPPDFGTDTSFSGPQAQIAAIQSLFKSGPGATFALDFQSAIAAGNVKYGTFAATIAPTNQPPPGVTPPSPTPPPPQPTPDCTAPSGAFTQRLTDMKLGALPFQIEVALSAHQKGLIGDISGALQCGDARIFSVQTVHQIIPPTGPSQEELVTTIYLTVTPVLAGLFKCIVAETSTATVGNVPVVTYTYWEVQINP